MDFLYGRTVEDSRRSSEPNGIMVITIGYHEVNNLMMLCQEMFSTKNVVCVTVQTSSGNAVQNGFTYVQEYIVFVTPPEFEPLELRSEKKNMPTLITV